MKIVIATISIISIIGIITLKTSTFYPNIPIPFRPKVWVLTGDKTETAMNIGYSAGLLGPEMILIRLQDRGQSVEVLRGQLKSLIRLFRQLAADKLDLNRIYTNMQASVNRIIFGKEKKNSIKKNDNSNNNNKNDNSNAKNNDNDNDSSNDDDGSNIADNVGKNQFNQIESGIRRRKQNLHDSDYDYPNNDDIEETLNPLIPNSSSGSPDTFDDDDDENESEKEGRIRLDQLTSESLALIVDGYVRTFIHIFDFLFYFLMFNLLFFIFYYLFFVDFYF